MTVDELLEDIRRRMRTGAISGDDDVYVRNPQVSEEAMSAGSNGWTPIGSLLVVNVGAGSDVGVEPGLYLEPEEE